MKEVIIQAIRSRRKVKITCLYEDGVSAELEVLPFIIGKDFFGYEFVFGHINEFFLNCYKFRLAQIKKIELLNDSFTLPEDAVYTHAFGEDWEEVDEEFKETRSFCKGFDLSK